MSKKFRVSVGDTIFEVNEGESVSDAAERQGLRVRVSCRNGVCWVCEATVEVGSLFDGSQGKDIGPGGVVRLCRSIALSDVAIATGNIGLRGDISVKEYACQVAKVEALSEDVFRVVLRLPAGTKSEFIPGQYLSINMPGSEPAFFSIASQPGGREIELHVQASPHRESAMSVLQHLRNSLTVKVSLPYGKACLTNLPAGAVVLLGAGTGYAQLKSILDALMLRSPEQSVKLFWGGREKRDLYLLKEAEALGERHPNLEVVPVYADIADNDWSGHHEQLVGAVLKACPDLAGVEVFVSGSPGLVYAALDEFEKHGLKTADFYSDVLEYAPRS